MLNPFYSKEAGKITFTAKQASDFAKQIAQDFNPLHNEDNKRFCVPGDFMFALVLEQYGISQHLHFDFKGMVKGGSSLDFPPFEGDTLDLKDESNKTYLTVTKAGSVNQDKTFIDSFIYEYVAFSGQTFPHILVPLMRQEGLMINPVKPLVIYENMEINLDSFSDKPVTLECLKTKLEVKGKRGNVTLEFCVKSEGETIGTGNKHLIIGGLRAFDEDKIREMVAINEALRAGYKGSGNVE